MSRDLDVVLYGATGFSGRPAVAYLDRRAAKMGIRWAVCGRNETALRALVAGSTSMPEVLVADARDAEALSRVAARTTVMASFIGPYGPLGDLVPAACVREGTHYADLCGEQDVIAARIADLHGPASVAKVKLIPACGYESVPFDLGALALDHAFEIADGSRLAEVDVMVTFVLRRGPLRSGHGTSGGTFATVIRSATEVPHLTACRHAGRPAEHGWRRRCPTRSSTPPSSSVRTSCCQKVPEADTRPASSTSRRRTCRPPSDRVRLQGSPLGRPAP